MATVVGSGSQACTISTEHSLDTETTAGSFVLLLDVSPLVEGATPDILVVKLKRKVLTGGTVRTYEFPAVVGSQVNPIWESPPWTSMFSSEVTITQTQGTGRTIDWQLVRLND